MQHVKDRLQLQRYPQVCSHLLRAYLAKQRIADDLGLGSVFVQDQEPKSSRRPPEEIVTLYKYGWNGYDKAYGKLNHIEYACVEPFSEQDQLGGKAPLIFS